MLKKRLFFPCICICVCVSLLLAESSFAEAYTHWQLPEGVFARLGKGWTTDFVFSPDGSHLAVASSIGLYLYETTTYQGVALITEHAAGLDVIKFSPDGKTIAGVNLYLSNHNARLVHFWDAKTGKHKHTLKHTPTVVSMAFSPDSTSLATGCSDGSVHFWDAETGRRTQTLSEHTDTVDRVAFSPDGKTLLCYGGESLTLWDAKTSSLKHVLEHPSRLHSVDFSPDGKTITTQAMGDTSVHLWAVSTGEHIRTLTGHTGAFYSVIFSPDGKTFATGREDKTIRLWDVSIGEHIRTLTGHTRDIHSVMFSPDGKTITTGSYDGTLRVWGANTGIHTHTLTGHTDRIVNIAFSRKGRTLATACGHGMLRLWDVSTGEHRRTLFLDRDADPHIFPSVAFSPDGKVLATASRSDNHHAFHFWDVKTGKRTRTFTGHTDRVYSVAFSPDGKVLATGSEDGTVLLWDVPRTRVIYEHADKFGSLVEWRGRYSDELSEDSGRFQPLKRFLPNHPDGSVWILDSEACFDFGSAWVLYNALQNIRKYKPERDLLSLYFSPRWRHVDTVIVKGKGVIEDWQITVNISRKRFLMATPPSEPLRQQRMVLIPAGEFLMGSNDIDAYDEEQPVRTVYVDAFYMDTTEVTNAQFKAFVDANPAWQKDRIEPRFAIHEEYLRDWNGNHYPKGRGNYPVTYVNWYAAMAYAEWVGKRLPTEAEWEYAARGGLVSKKYPNGDTMTPKDAHYLKRDATAVARYAVNGYGLYDMAGNIWEWCLDAYHEDFYDTFPKDGVAQNPLSGANDVEWLLTVEWLLKNWRTAQGKRVLRGGCHLNSPQALRVAARINAWGNWSDYAFGFRCARSLTPEHR